LGAINQIIGKYKKNFTPYSPARDLHVYSASERLAGIPEELSQDGHTLFYLCPIFIGISLPPNLYGEIRYELQDFFRFSPSILFLI
jgi:hypothetical protein